MRRRKGAARSRDVVSLSLSELLSAGRLGCIQFNFIFHYLGIYRHINTRLFRDKMTHLSLLSSPHQGGALLPCLSGNIFMGCTLHFTGSTITGTGSLAQGTTKFDINLSDPDDPPVSFELPDPCLLPYIDLPGCNSLEHCFVLRSFY